MLHLILLSLFLFSVSLAPRFEPAHKRVDAQHLNELITNAFKYGVPAGARSEGAEYDLQVEITEANRQLTLVVRDRGPGLPPAFNFAKGQSLGLQLVRSLARQLKARVSSRTDGGAVFELTFRV